MDLNDDGIHRHTYPWHGKRKEFQHSDPRPSLPTLQLSLSGCIPPVRSCNYREKNTDTSGGLFPLKWSSQGQEVWIQLFLLLPEGQNPGHGVPHLLKLTQHDVGADKQMNPSCIYTTTHNHWSLLCKPNWKGNRKATHTLHNFFNSTFVTCRGIFTHIRSTSEQIKSI